MRMRIRILLVGLALEFDIIYTKTIKLKWGYKKIKMGIKLSSKNGALYLNKKELTITR